MTEEDIRTEPDVVSRRLIRRPGLVSAIAVAAAVLAVWALSSFHWHGGGRSGVVELNLLPPADPFEDPVQPEIQRAAIRAQLERWQWADPQHRKVLVPIDAAMELYLARRAR